MTQRENSVKCWPDGLEPIFVDYFVEPGIAKGAYDLASRGTGLRVTCWPNPRNQMRPLPWNHVRGIPMWNQEMYVLSRQLGPEIGKRMDKEVARMHWAKLWERLQEIPEELAIESDEPTGKTGSTRLMKRQAEMRERSRWAIWNRKVKILEFTSVFCAQEEHARCKQIDCACKCHF